ncbi:tetratricopeptide repeat protein [Candidatus Protochlamydia phocaeensis]|uniref:tetratricopeptide repeat protein n=1 Tax=Candidatus Protochlamydia phocaeensis TaxID=1414722 RepID=UPI00083829A0|nr:hypothetical protein [Candidatus Protochlamydia phocaeensis]
MTLKLDLGKRFIHVLLIGGLAFAGTSCQPVQSKMDPVIIYTPPPQRISELPSAFSPLSEEEKQQEWARELLMGDAFAREWDFYRAITCYKRALILIPDQAIERRLQLDYDMILCYYLGHKYQEAINIFEASDLIQVNPLFPAFNNLLLILYECYQQTQQEEKAECIWEVINKCSPETAMDLSLFWHLKKGQIEEAQAEVCGHRDFQTMQPDLDLYYQYAKSPTKAKYLNAILPGAGYYYVGQRKAAVTSFIINALFTAAAYQFFRHGYPAAGLITASLEMGWYYGGMNGARIEAEEFNNRLYEGVSKKILTDHRLFPVLMFETSF